MVSQKREREREKKARMTSTSCLFYLHIYLLRMSFGLRVCLCVCLSTSLFLHLYANSLPHHLDCSHLTVHLSTFLSVHRSVYSLSVSCTPFELSCQSIYWSVSICLSLHLGLFFPYLLNCSLWLLGHSW